MPDIVQLLEMLQSKNPDKRYAACEELRVAKSIPDEALTALRKVITDPDPYVADAAARALAAHTAGPPEETVEYKAVEYKAVAKKATGPEIRRAKEPYSRLRFSPLLTVFTFAIYSFIADTSQSGPSDFYITTLGAILVSALWHLFLIQYVTNSNREFVRWHGRQALLLAGLRTLICLIFLGVDAIAGSNGSLFFWVIPVLIVMWLIMTPWGNGQAERGECALATWMGYEITAAEEIMEEDSGPIEGAQAHDKPVSSGLPADTRRIILAEINTWEKEGLVQPAQAAALRQRYAIEPPPSAPPIPAPVKVTPRPAPVVQSSKPAEPPKPQSTLTERLLSQTSINIFLYLGAFLVIGSAMILAALVAAARMPVLLASTLIFGVGAAVIKKRLPQPSITLFVIFSCLLPIDGYVAAQNFHLTGQAADAYWAAVFFSMALIWGLATWFYTSRLFSVLSFVGLGLALLRFSEIFNPSLEWNAFSAVVSANLGLLGVLVLRDWKDNKFAQPLFITAQIVQGLALLTSFGFVSGNQLADLFGGTAAGAQGLASAFTWIGAAAFYAWSELLFPFSLFPWAAAASLLPVSWLALKSFNASNPAQITGLFIWGALLAFVSEYFARRDSPKAREYYLPLVLGSVPLLLSAILWSFTENISYGFDCLLGTAIVYTLLMIVHPRQLVWTGALFAALAAYFTFFQLPSMGSVDVLAQYQLLGAALLLTVPELFFKSELTPGKAWRWPPFLFGILIILINVIPTTYFLISGVNVNNDAAVFHSRQTAAALIVFGVYALLFAAYALHLHRPRLGYLATASAALAVVFFLQHYDLDQWLPVLSGLSLAYFVAGYFLRGGKRGVWGSMLRLSSLTLGTLISVIVLFTLKATGGWYVLLTGVLFMIETYLRPEDRMEAGSLVFFSAAAYLILRDLHLDTTTYVLLAISLIWLISDLLFDRTLKPRRMAQFTRLVGGFVAALNALQMLSPALATILGLAATVAPKQYALAFGVYALFFALQAWFYRNPRLGYAATASLALSIAFTLQYFQRDLWLPLLSGLALTYYAAGYFLHTKKITGWGGMLRISGLMLGTLVSLFALFTLKHAGGWYALVIGILFAIETYLSRDDRLEIGVPILFNIAAFLVLHDFKVNDFSYHLLAYSLIWLGADGIFSHTLKPRRLALLTRLVGGLLVFGNAVIMLLPLVEPKTASIGFGVYAVFFALYAWAYRKPVLGYAATASLPLSVFFLLRVLNQDNWLYAIVSLAVIYYAAGTILRRGGQGNDWGQMLLLSGLGLGVINSVSAVFQVGLSAAIPVAIAATLFAAEAFARRNVWLGFPANLLYLEAYFLILVWLKVDQPQFFSVGTALLGMLMHYLLTRAGSRTGAFLTGMFSQLVLLGTTYIQMFSTQQFSYFVVIFLEALAVLAYGIIARSRSLIIAPILFIVLSVFTVLYTALKGISTVILIGGAGLILLLFGISAVVLRERITKISERLSEWNA